MPHLQTLIALGLLLANIHVVEAKPFQHRFGELREYFQHWLAVCPNDADADAIGDYRRTCWASTFSSNRGGAFPGYRFSIQRDRFTGERKVRMVLDEKSAYPDGGTVTIRFSDGTTKSFEFGRDIVPYGNSINEFTFADPKDNEAIIEKRKKATHVRLYLPRWSGTQEVQFSAIGVTKALDFLETYADK